MKLVGVKIVIPLGSFFNFIQQKSPTSISGEMNAAFINSVGVQILTEVKPPADATDFKRNFAPS